MTNHSITALTHCRTDYRKCGRQDLNLHGLLHTPLKRARLPISPLPQCHFHLFYNGAQPKQPAFLGGQNVFCRTTVDSDIRQTASSRPASSETEGKKIITIPPKQIQADTSHIRQRLPIPTFPAGFFCTKSIRFCRSNPVLRKNQQNRPLPPGLFFGKLATAHGFGH